MANGSRVGTIANAKRIQRGLSNSKHKLRSWQFSLRSDRIPNEDMESLAVLARLARTLKDQEGALIRQRWRNPNDTRPRAPFLPDANKVECIAIAGYPLAISFTKLRFAGNINHMSCTLQVLPNWALNLTLCGGPALAAISFLAKASPPQSAG